MKFRLLPYLMLAFVLSGCLAGAPGGKKTNQPTPESTRAPTPKEKTPMRVFCAGSLIRPFDELEKAFEAIHPEVDVLMECHGSIQVIRHVTELHEKIDVVATADHALIPMLMYATTDAETGKPYADWYIRFASNRLALAYSPQSQGVDQINEHNWYNIISQPGVRLGIADPRFDAAGYRALMALRLAEDAYNQPDLFDNVIEGRFKYPITIFEDDNFTEIGVPEILEPKPDSGILTRGASIQLIALLESGDLDYAFEYESVIRQQRLKWVELPDAVNLGNETYNPQYNRVQVRMDFQRFASVEPVFKGEQIGYAITIPTNAPQPDLAAEFIAFMLSPEGRRVMEANFHPLLEQPVCDQAGLVPAELRSFCPGEFSP
jgi:molybdate/tungstate transport system substrate-binding protein